MEKERRKAHLKGEEGDRERGRKREMRRRERRGRRGARRIDDVEYPG